MIGKIKKYSFYLVLVIFTLAMAFLLNRTERRLDGMIESEHLRYTGEIRNASPMVVFTTVALGSLRGVIADLLWLRALSLQDKGNYFEMVQLARWMTDLQPNFAGAANYLAWNMAYNISVTCSTPEERWKWVQEGVKLLRDRAIVYNPEDPILYRDLGWIFQHKMGNILDSANLYYKNQLAMQMNRILGSNPDWEGFAAAPANEKEFLAKYAANSSYQAALSAAGMDSYEKLWTYFRNEEKLPEKFVNALPEKLRKPMEDYFKSEYLRLEYKLDPKLILEINNRYGNLDWRLPESQAIYWATMGLKKTPGNRNLDCERMITQAMYDAFKSGRLLLLDDKKFEDIIVIPNLDLIDAVKRTYEETYKQNDNDPTFRSAKINFIKNAITILYNYGRESKAKEYYRELAREEPRYRKIPMENFVMSEWVQNIKDASNKKATDVIVGLLFQSCTFLAYGELDAAAANEKTAAFVYAYYTREFKDVEGRSLAPYADIKRTVVENCLQAFPPALSAALRQRLAEEAAKKPPSANTTQQKEEP